MRFLPLCLALAAVHLPLAAQVPDGAREPLPVTTAPDGTVLTLDAAFLNPMDSSTFFVRTVSRPPPGQPGPSGADRRVETRVIDCASTRSLYHTVTELAGDSVVSGPSVPLPGDTWAAVPEAERPTFQALCGVVKAEVARIAARSQPLSQAASETGPELLNVTEVVRMLQRKYPPALSDARVSGTVLLMMRVGADGRVGPDSFAFLTASRPEFVRATADVVARMQFTPGTVNGAPVATWVDMPLSFAVAP
jgi:TonB family protein